MAHYRQINAWPCLFGVKPEYFIFLKKMRLNGSPQALRNEGSAVILLGEHRVREDARRGDSGVGRSEELCPEYGGVCACESGVRGETIRVGRGATFGHRACASG